jgi:hypothetical protein
LATPSSKAANLRALIRPEQAPAKPGSQAGAVLEGIGRFTIVTAPRKGPAQGEMKLGRIGIDRQAAVASLDRRVDPGAFEHEHGEIGVGGHIVGAKLDNPPQRLFRVLHLAKPVQHGGEVEPDVGQIWLCCKRAVVDLHRIVQVAGFTQPHTQRPRGGGTAGPAAQRLAIGGFGGRGLAPHAFDGSQVAVKIRDCGLDSDRLADHSGGLRRAAPLRNEDPQQVQGIGVRRVALQGLALQGLGFVEPPASMQGHRSADQLPHLG